MKVLTSIKKYSNFSFKYLLTVSFGAVFFVTTANSQEYVNVENISILLNDELKSEFEDIDSLEMTIFIKFTINSEGRLDSIWVNGEEPKNTDYDSFLKASKNELTRWMYLNLKREYLIRRKIFEVLKGIRISHSQNVKFKGFYVLPIYLNFKRGLRNFYFENNYHAMKSFFKSGIHEYYFLEPLGISTISGQVKVKNKKK